MEKTIQKFITEENYQGLNDFCAKNITEIMKDPSLIIKWYYAKISIQEHEDAKALLEKALILHPTNQDLEFAYAYLHLLLGEIEEAQSKLDLILQKNPQFIEAQFLQITIYALTQDTLPQAKLMMEKLLNQQPNDENLQYIYILILRDLDLKEEYSQSLQAIQTSNPELAKNIEDATLINAISAYFQLASSN